MANTRKEEVDVKKIYGQDCMSSTEDFKKKYNVKDSGITNQKAQENIKNFGYNQIKQAKPKKWYNYFLSSLLSPFNSILLGISFILVYTDIILPENPSPANIIVIAVLVLVSTLLEFFEVFRSNNAAEKLKEMVETTSAVIRDGKKIQIPLKEVTFGDTVILSAGDMIPADLRVIEAKDLYVGQSSITGESDAVRKTVNTELANIDEIESITDLDNICFMGTNVISGSAKAVVIKTGDNTYFGKVARTLTQGKPKTNFQKGIESISKLLIKFMLVLIPIIFLLNAWKHDYILAFTFAVAIAITITPLLLPVILTSCLSKGAVRMSKKKTIVKKLDSIQNFGAMNVLCTDKTGTLTEDKIVLEKYLDVYGNENIRVLRHAFLNSYFQTGLKGSIDEAVINRALKNNLSSLLDRYKKIDEIPFDFSRRRLSVVVENESDRYLITKGAVEEILNICTTIDYEHEIKPITREIKENIKKIAGQLNEEGLRVVAVCQKKVSEEDKEFSVQDETQMSLVGFVGFLDPPKESAKLAVEKLNNAGIRVIVLTGDNAAVTKCICKKVNINTQKIVTGNEIDKLADNGVVRLLKKSNVFVKLSPIQKARIVRILKESGNVVGYMGDGINDAPSLTNSDVGVSVDTAVDIAKETADIILLEKDLNVLLDGVTEGRRTFGNLMKYIKMAVSFNFGEVMSVIMASVLLPFLPETPIQLLTESLLYDFGQMTLPFDNVDKEYLQKPKRLEIMDLKHFMLFMGPLSSIFDLLVFASLWFIFGIREAAIFQTVWFSYSIVSNLIGMHIIRTAKNPITQSHASRVVFTSSILLSIIGILVPYTILGKAIGLVPVTLKYLNVILGVTGLYCVVALFAKRIYIKKYGTWI